MEEISEMVRVWMIDQDDMHASRKPGIGGAVHGAPRRSQDSHTCWILKKKSSVADAKLTLLCPQRCNRHILRSSHGPPGNRKHTHEQGRQFQPHFSTLLTFSANCMGPVLLKVPNGRGDSRPRIRPKFGSTYFRVNPYTRCIVAVKGMAPLIPQDARGIP